MADFNKVKQDIKDDIRPNGVGEITGQTMQDTLVEIVELEEQAYNELNSEIETSKREASQEITKTNTRLATAEKNISDNKTEASQEIAKTNTRLATAENNISNNKTEANLKFAEVKEALENKAQVDERYPKLTAGFADNLVGRGEATHEEFVFQPTANDVSVQDGTARIKSVKGNSVVWNQLIKKATNLSVNGITLTWQDDHSIRVTGTPTAAAILSVATLAPLAENEKIFVRGCPQGGSTSTFALTDQGSQTEIGNGAIWGRRSYQGAISFVPVIRIGSDCVGQQIDLVFHPLIISLTKMFGAGNEPITVEDFYARIPSGIDIHAYNEGEIISMHTEAIKTVGFNQWDEQWEVGHIHVDGGNLVYATKIRSTNYIRVIPEYNYYYTAPVSLNFALFDENKKLVGRWFGGDSDFDTENPQANTLAWHVSSIRRIPKGVHYIRFSTYGNNILTYNHDICINLSHTGYKNGTYLPYETFTRELGVIKKYFPNGMRSAGSVADSIEWDSSRQKWVAVQRIGEVDLGSLKWSYGYGMFTGEGTNAAPGLNVLCTRYASGYNDKNIRAHYELDGYIFVYDSSYSDPATFKASVQGVMLYYELAEPIVTEIESIPELDYLVWDFGTEEALSSVPSAPFSADIIYQFNAVDRIRENTLRVQALENIIAQMQAQMASMTAQVTNEEV